MTDRPTAAAVVDLLGAIAYGELSAFERLAEDAKLAPAWRTRSRSRRWPAPSSATWSSRDDRITELGADPFAAMAPFHRALDVFHAHTAPADWYEGLIKAYVGDGLAADFYREIAAYLDADTRDLIVVVARGRRRTPRSSSTGSVRRSPPTRRSVVGWRSGAVG